MKPTNLTFSRMPMVFVAVAAVMVLAACSEATKTSKGLGFGTEGLMVAVVPTLTAGTPMTAVTLPEADGGSGTVTYSVTPMVPGPIVRSRHACTERYTDGGRRLPPHLHSHDFRR